VVVGTLAAIGALFLGYGLYDVRRRSRKNQP
jgi:hypothetical protein